MKNSKRTLRYRRLTINRCFFVAWMVLLCLAGVPTDAALLAITNNTAPGGINNITYDTATGLEWLDVTTTGNISYDDITLQFAAAGAFEGWRHATRAEVQDLLINLAGLTLGHQPIVDPLATQFIGLVGITQASSFPNATAVRGRYNDNASGNIVNMAGTASVIFATQTFVNSTYTLVTILDDQPVINSAIPTSGTGHWLVRSVPEPATLSLLVMGGIVMMRRRFFEKYES